MPAVSVAAPTTAENPPLDVVLLMDSSGSMKKTDPKELRKPAAKLFLSLLGAEDRASVVSFSDKGYPVAFLTGVKGKANEKKLFAAVDKISTKGVYTNLHGAVEAALRVFNRNPLPNRKRTIVLMTDGKMDVGASEKNTQLSKALREDLLPQLKDKNIELHTIAFTDQSDQRFLEKIAVDSGGKFNLAKNDKALHDVYTDIFEQNKQPNMLPFDGEKFTIDKAIKEVTIVGSKDSEDTQLSLLTPSGKIFSAKEKPEAIKWYTSQNFDLITINAPDAGEWQIKASTGKNKAYIITDLKFQLTLEPQELAIGEGLMINAWLEDKGEIINKPSVLTDLAMELQVSTPDGETHVLELEPTAMENDPNTASGIYMSHIALPSEGRYQIQVTASAATFSRERTSSANVIDPRKLETTATPEATEEVEEEPAAPVEPEPTVTTSDAEVPAVTPSIEPPIAPVIDPLADMRDTPIVAEDQANEHVEPAVADSTADAKSESKNEKPKAENKKPETDKSKQKGGNLLKAMLIFFGINGVLALIGGIAFVLWRRKNKKAANTETENEPAEAEEKKAA
ncbi:vWA domain-containing protein [Kaarinaea lacus]